MAHAPAAAGAGAGAAPGRRAVRGGGRRARRLPRRRGAPPDDRRRLGLGGPAPADEDAHAGGDREGARLRARRGRGAPPPGGRGAPAGRARRHPGQPGLAPARCARGPPAALRARDGALPAGRHPAAHARGRPGAQPGRGPRGGRHRGARQRRLPDERGDRRVLILAAALAAVVVALVLWLGHTRRTAAALEERLAAAAGSLESLQQAFARFAPAQVVEDIIAQGVSTRSEKKEVTVLFADLKDFTALAEHLDPDLLVRILNGYFERLSRAITNHRGHVAKFIGDGILALFGALEENPWQTNDAAHAALAMRAALADYNAALAADGLPALAMGVGIHRGTVVAGVIGSAELIEYGVIGSAVNLAARVQELTRAHAVDVLVTAAVRDALDPRFTLHALPPLEVKGLPAPVGTFAVDRFDAETRAQTPSTP
ncbi:MAG: adenylate/guanylate cyclase domain-containing protein [Deltaproteobacteria bacterium]|nr:MAG: adenylate/guanylate cyclase domain-containing protein [Deltaproteobacteria bacterium]